MGGKLSGWLPTGLVITYFRVPRAEAHYIIIMQPSRVVKQQQHCSYISTRRKLCAGLILLLVNSLSRLETFHLVYSDVLFSCTFPCASFIRPFERVAKRRIKLSIFDNLSAYEKVLNQALHSSFFGRQLWTLKSGKSLNLKSPARVSFLPLHPCFRAPGWLSF